MTIPVLDGHNDALTADWGNALGARHDTGHIDVPRMREGGLRAAFFAVWVGPEIWPEEADLLANPQPDGHGGERFDLPPAFPFTEAAAMANRTAGRLLWLERAGDLRVARSIADLDAAREGDGPPAAILHLEGADPIDPGLEALELWYAAGLRSLGPVWSRPTDFAHGVPLLNVPTSPDTGPGLTEAGQALVRRCSELGIMIDLAHLNEAGFWDVARAELGPLVSSHTAAHALAPSSRNLTDAQIDAIGDTGGLVGIVYGVRFLRPDLVEDADTPVELIARHAAYVAKRIGVDHVGLGSDFDGTTVPAALRDVTDLALVLDALRAEGFSEDDVEKIAWSNWRRVLDAWWH